MSETKLQPNDVRNSTASAEEDRLWTVVEAARFLHLSPGRWKSVTDSSKRSLTEAAVIVPRSFKNNLG
jgi:hypothetical protein